MLVLGAVQEIEGHVADGRHVLGTVSGPEAAEVLVGDDVEHPTQTVLDMPVLSDDKGKEFGIEGE